MTVSKKYLSVGYTCTGTVDEVVYSVSSTALYAEVHSVILSNIVGTDKTATVKWQDFSTQTTVASTFWGDGNTNKDWVYDYSSYSVITDGVIPNGASLHVLDGPLFLDPEDFITVSASDKDSVTVTVIVTECFEDGQQSSLTTGGTATSRGGGY